MPNQIIIERTPNSYLIAEESKENFYWRSILFKPRETPTKLNLTAKELKYNFKSEIDSRFIAEEHHHFYGKPWCLGRDQFNYLKNLGLKPRDYFLDLGCGALRAGIWLIDFLAPSRYFGIDAHLKSLEAAVYYEIPLHNLEKKYPRILWDNSFSIAHFGIQFDWILAHSLFIHLAPEEIDIALKNIASNLNKDGCLVFNGVLPLPEKELKRHYKLALANRENQKFSFIEGSIEWFELRLI